MSRQALKKHRGGRLGGSVGWELLRLRSWSLGPGIEPRIGLPTRWGACFSLCLSPLLMLPVSHRFETVVFSLSFVSMNFFNSSLISWLTHSVFSRMLFSLHIFEFFPNFLLWLSPSLRALWSENMQGMIPIFWYQLRPDLWPSMWSVVENVPWALEKNVYSVALG